MLFELVNLLYSFLYSDNYTWWVNGNKGTRFSKWWSYRWKWRRSNRYSRNVVFNKYENKNIKI